MLHDFPLILIPLNRQVYFPLVLNDLLNCSYPHCLNFCLIISRMDVNFVFVKLVAKGFPIGSNLHNTSMSQKLRQSGENGQITEVKQQN